MTDTLIGRRSLLGLAGAVALLGSQATAMAKAVVEPLEIASGKRRTKFLVEIADDDAERERGLMFRTHLAPDRGMLFDFKTEREVAFWMKNTLIPLDMVYIRANGKIFSIAANAVPGSLVPIPSGGPVRAVLEIAGGRAAQLGLLPGDHVFSRIFPRG